MKTNLYKIAFLLLGFCLGLAACTPDEHSLGGGMAKEELMFSVRQDVADPNTVYIEALNKGVSVAWITPQGRSIRTRDTLRIAFPGAYEFTYGVLTDGGYVQADPFVLHIATTNLAYVQDEMWVLLTGGVGKEKTWVPDNGNYGMKQGFYSCFDPTTTYLDMTADPTTPYNWIAQDKTWWEPANADVNNTEDDLNSYMTFSLQGKAGLTMHRFTDGTETVSQGVFDMNTTAHTISAVDADFVHGAWADGKAVNFRTGFQILVLTEHQLMIGNYRDESLSGEGRCIFCWNFVSKEWADSYVPVPTEPEPTEPVLPEGWKEEISETVSVITSSTIRWTLSAQTPVNWATQSGRLLNEWNSAADYPDWLGTPDPDSYAAFSMTLDSKAMKATFTDLEGNTTACNYALDEKGLYTFDGPVPSFPLVGWMSFGAGKANTFRILQINKDATGAVANIWLGTPNPDKPETEYIAYCLTPTAVGAGAGETPEEKMQKLLASQTWVLDVAGTASYDHPKEGTLTGPTACYGWGGNWRPEPGSHYAIGLVSSGLVEEMTDYGSMTFTQDGKVTVVQRQYTYEADGESGRTQFTTEALPAWQTNATIVSSEVLTFTGTYSVDLTKGKIKMSVPMLHPSSAGFMCADWGDLEIIQASSSALFLTVYRKAEIENVAPWVYVFVPKK